MTPTQIATQINRAIRDDNQQRLDQCLAHPEVTEALATLGRSGNDTWRLPLSYAVRRGNPLAVKKLLAKGAKVEFEQEKEGLCSSLFDALRFRQFACAQELLKSADLSFATKTGTRLFDIALSSGDATWIERFSKGAKLDYANTNGKNTLHWAATGGNRDWIDKILAKTSFKAGDETKSKRRTIDMCTDLATWQYLRSLAPQLPACITFTDDKDSLWMLADAGAADILHHLIETGEKIDRTYSTTRNTLLHAASGSGVPRTAEVLVKGGHNVNARNAYNYRPLHWAVQLDDVAMVQALLQLKAKPNVKTNNTFIIQETRTPLYFAAGNGNVPIAQALLAAGALPNDLCDSSNATALTEAVSHDELAVAQVLLNAGANPNGQSRDERGVDFYYFPLASARSPEMIKLLMEHGAQVNQRNRHGDSVLKSIANRENMSDAELGALEALLAAGADPRGSDMHGITALTWAKDKRATALLAKAMKGEIKAAPLSGEVATAQKQQDDYREGINALAGLMAGKDPSTVFGAKGKRGNSPIAKELFERAHDMAYKVADLESFWALLEIATPDDVNFVSMDSYYDDESTLHRVAEEVGSLIEKPEGWPLMRNIVARAMMLGADPNAVDNDGDTPLHHLMYYTAYRTCDKAALEFITHIADLLLDAGAAVNAKNHEKSTPLDAAGYVELAQHLIGRGAQYSGCSSGCIHALEYEVRWDDAVGLIKLGARVNETNKDGLNLLSIVSSKVDIARYDELVQLGAAWPKLRKGIDSPLARAADAGNLPLVHHLVAKHAKSVNHVGQYGRTAFAHLAFWTRDTCEKENRPQALDALMALVGHGADIHHKDSYGDVAIDVVPTKPMREKLIKRFEQVSAA
jgi:ankyrin repeat protein